MLTKERTEEISQYVFQLLYPEIESLNNNLKPITPEEFSFFHQEHTWKRYQKIDQETLEERKKIAYQKAEELVRKYLPKEFWSDGFFNSEEFIKIIEKTKNEAKEDMSLILTEETFIKKFLRHLEKSSLEKIDILYTEKFEEKLIKNLLIEKNIDIKNLTKSINKNYLNELKKIEKEYKINLDKYKFLTKKEL